MGGDMTLSMRLPDGEVHHFSIWTNILPGMMQDPTFLGRGEAFDEFMASVKPGNVWPKSAKLLRYRHGEYGTVMVDFVTKKVTSRQGYCDPDRATVDLESDGEWLKELLDRGASFTFAHYQDGAGWVDLNAATQAVLLRALTEGTREEYLAILEGMKGRYRGLVKVREAHKGWTFDHDNSTPNHNKKAAKVLATVRKSWEVKGIPIEEEPKPWDLLGCERCCMCRNRTRWWTKLPDRTPGQQVALCPVCAKTTAPESIPTKREWCDKERALEPKGFSDSPWAFTGISKEG